MLKCSTLTLAILLVAECSMGFVFKKNELNENISILNNTVEGTAPDLGAYEWKPAAEPEPTAEEEPTPASPEPNDTTVVTSLDPTSGAHKKEFMIYPNPASHSLTVRQAGDYPQSFSVELINLLGVPLVRYRSSAGGQVQFDLSAYASGIYFVRLRASGEETIQRVIKR